MLWRFALWIHGRDAESRRLIENLTRVVSGECDTRFRMRWGCCFMNFHKISPG
jgi:hypothetical protein